MARASRAAGGQSIAVVGLGCRFPDANDPAGLLDLILSGRRAFRRIPPCRVDLADYYSAIPGTADATYSTRAALIEGWRFNNAAFGVPAETYLAADPAYWLALETAASALAAAGFPDGTGLPRDRTAVVIGNTLGGEQARVSALRLRWPYVRQVVAEALHAEGLPAGQSSRVLRRAAARYLAPFTPVTSLTLAGASPAGFASGIGAYFGFRGGSFALDGGSASGLLAVATACAGLASGEIDVAVAGGVDLSLDPLELVGMAKAGVLATFDMRIYDQNPTGFLPGEGCGMVVLMRTADAVAAGRPVHSAILGWGTAEAGKLGQLSQLAAEPGSYLLALRRAYHRAGVDPADVALFEGAGTGIAAADEAELVALTELRAGSRRHAAIGSVTASIGHSRAAAGAAGLIKTVLAVSNAVVPPAVGIRTPHPIARADGAGLRFPQLAERWAEGTRLAGVSAAGLDDLAVHLVLRNGDHATGKQRKQRFGRRSRSAAAEASVAGPAVFPHAGGGPDRHAAYLVHAPDRAALAAVLSRIADVAPWLSDGEMADLACQLGREARTQGPARAAIVASRQEQLARLAAEAVTVLPHLGDGLLAVRPGIFAADGADGRVTLLLPDDRRLSAADPGGEQRGAAHSAHAQALTAVQATLCWLDQLGVRPCAAVGDGVGWLAGLAWAGCLSEPDVLKLGAARAAALRGRPGDAQERLRGVVGRLGIHPPHRRLISASTGKELASSQEIAAILAGGPAARDVLDQALRAGAVGSSLLLEAGPGTELTAAAAAVSRVPAISLDASVDRDRDTARACAALFAVGALTQPDYLFAGQHWRPIDIWREQVFITSPCQAVTVISDLEAGDAIGEPPEAGNAPGEPAAAGDAASEPTAAGYATAEPAKASEPTAEPAEASDASSEPTAAGYPTAEPAKASEPTAEPAEASDATSGPTAAGYATAEPAKASDAPSEPAAPTPQPAPASEAAQAPADAARHTPQSEAAQALAVPVATEPAGESVPAADQVPVGLAAGEHPSRVSWQQSPAQEAAAPAAQDARPAAANALPTVQLATCYVAELREPARPVRDPGDGPWRVHSGGCDPLAAAVRELFPHDPGAGRTLAVIGHGSDRGTLRAAARAVTDAIETGQLVVITEGRELAGLWACLHAEHPAAGITVVQAPATAAGLRAARAIAAVAPGEYRELATDADCLVREAAMVPALLPGDGIFPLGQDDVAIVSREAGPAGLALAQVLACAGAAVVIIGGAQAGRDEQLGSALYQLQAAGAAVSYEVVDLGDAAGLAAAVDRIEQRLGPVTAVGHGVGRMPQLAVADVTDAAMLGHQRMATETLANLLGAIGPDRLKLIATFGRDAARSGLAGQAALALASAALADQGRRLALSIGCRSVHVDWPAGSSAGADPAAGAAQHGIGQVTIDAGSRLLLKILAAPGLPAEIAVRQVAAPPVPRAPAMPGGDRRLAGRFCRQVLAHHPGVELVCESQLSLQADPYLDDYRVDGLPVLPVPMALEAMAQAASALAGEPVLDMTQVLVNAPVVIPAGLPEQRTAIRIRAVRTAGSVTVTLRSEQSGFAVDHLLAVFGGGQRQQQAGNDGAAVARPPSGSATRPPSGSATRPPSGSVAGPDLYGHVCFQTGRFRRISLLQSVTSRSCTAVASGDDDREWFGAGGLTDDPLILGSPGLTDAMFQAVQACVPHRLLLPGSCESAVFSGLPVRGPVRITAVEVTSSPGAPGSAARAEPVRTAAAAKRPVVPRQRAPSPRNAGPAAGPGHAHAAWDVTAHDATGHQLVSLRGLRFSDSGPLHRAAPWPVPLLAAYLEWTAGAVGLAPDLRVSISPHPAVARDSKPAAPGRRWTAAGPSGDQLAAFRLRVSAAGGAACSWCAVLPLPAGEASPGPRLTAIESLLAGYGEPAEVVRARARAIGGCLPAAAAGARVIRPRDAGDGWLVLAADHAVIACVAVSVAGVEPPVAIAVMTGTAAERRSPGKSRRARPRQQAAAGPAG